MCRMRENFIGQGMFEIRLKREVRDTGERRGGFIFLDRETHMSEDPRQENAGVLERLKLKADQCD